MAGRLFRQIDQNFARPFEGTFLVRKTLLSRDFLVMLRLLREDIAAILKHQLKLHNEGFSSTQILADFRKIIGRFRDYIPRGSEWKHVPKLLKVFKLHLVDVEYSVVRNDFRIQFQELKKNLAIH